MDNNKLMYFISAAQTLNFSEVARAHNISQPAISRQISLLEDELGVSLFLRVGKQLHLTSEGEIFLAEAIKILDVIQGAVFNVKRHSQEKRGKIKIVTANSCNAIYRRCIEEFTLRFPDIMIDTVVASGFELTKAVISGDFDFFFIAEYMIKDNENFEQIITHRDELLLAMPAFYPPVEDVNDFSKFEEYPFVGISYDGSPILSEEIKNVCLSRGYSPNIIHQYNRIDAVIWSVEAGAGISIVPKSLLSNFSSENVTLTPISGEDCYANCVAAWQRNNANYSAPKFKDIILELYQKTETSE